MTGNNLSASLKIIVFLIFVGDKIVGLEISLKYIFAILFLSCSEIFSVFI